MLELRPVCEHCGKPLPPNSMEAMICSFECTFCRDCIDDLLHGVCPNCGGGFVPRPSRPSVDRNNGAYLGNFPASQKIRHKPVDLEQHRRLCEAVAHIPPDQR